MNKKSMTLKVSLITGSLIFIDQISKFLMIKYFNGAVEINHGAAFSLPFPNLLLIFVTFFLIVSSAYLSHKYLNISLNKTQIVLSFFFAGALGNLIDRIFFGGVIDFIDIWIYPVFNLADVYLTVSVFYILLFYGKINRNNK